MQTLIAKYVPMSDDSKPRACRYRKYTIKTFYTWTQQFLPELVSVESQALHFLTALSPFSDGHFPVVWLLVVSPSQYMISASIEM